MKKVLLLIGLLLVGCGESTYQCPCVVVAISDSIKGWDGEKIIILKDKDGYLHTYHWHTNEARALSTRQVGDTL